MERSAITWGVGSSYLVVAIDFFFLRTFLPQDLGLGLLYWAVSRQRQRNDCCTGQSPGNEVTVLLVSLQASGGGGQIQAML